MNESVAAVIIALLLVNLIGLAVLGWRITSQSTDIRMHNTDNRLLEGRLTKLEARVENLPTHRDLAELRCDLSEVVKTVAAINGQAQAMTQMLRTIQEHLLENDR